MSPLLSSVSVPENSGNALPGTPISRHTPPLTSPPGGVSGIGLLLRLSHLPGSICLGRLFERIPRSQAVGFLPSWPVLLATSTPLHRSVGKWHSPPSSQQAYAGR